jgi:acyl transferase domain-containing protein
MGATLARRPAARAAMEACDAALVRHGVASVMGTLVSPDDPTALRRTDRAQAALFTMQVAQVAHWRELGIEPDAVVGFSLGEVAAAWAAGVHDLDDAARVIAACGQGARAVPARGRMMVCNLDAPDARRAAAGRLEVAAYNGPGCCVLAGHADAVEEVARELAVAGVRARVLEVEHPFHTGGMARAREVMGELLAGLRPSPAGVPVFSTVTGSLFAGPHDGRYWSHAVQAPVRFESTVSEMLRSGVGAFVQLGGHPDLERPLRACAADAAPRIVASLRRDRPAEEVLLDAAAQLHAA